MPDAALPASMVRLPALPPHACWCHCVITAGHAWQFMDRITRVLHTANACRDCKPFVYVREFYLVAW